MNSSSVVISLMPSSVFTRKEAFGTRSPTWIVMNIPLKFSGPHRSGTTVSQAQEDRHAGGPFHGWACRPSVPRPASLAPGSFGGVSLHQVAAAGGGSPGCPLRGGQHKVERARV